MPFMLTSLFSFLGLHDSPSYRTQQVHHQEERVHERVRSPQIFAVSNKSSHQDNSPKNLVVTTKHAPCGTRSLGLDLVVVRLVARDGIAPPDSRGAARAARRTAAAVPGAWRSAAPQHGAAAEPAGTRSALAAEGMFQMCVPCPLLPVPCLLYETSAIRSVFVQARVSLVCFVAPPQKTIPA